MDTMEDLKKICSCASGKPAGACCKSGQDCPCGSGEAAGDCCFEEEDDTEESSCSSC